MRTETAAPPAPRPARQTDVRPDDYLWFVEQGVGSPVVGPGTDRCSLEEELDVDAEVLAMVQAVATRLDRVKRAFAEVGTSVLLAELRHMPELVCEVLDELADFTEHAVGALQA